MRNVWSVSLEAVNERELLGSSGLGTGRARFRRWLWREGTAACGSVCSCSLRPGEISEVRYPYAWSPQRPDQPAVEAVRNLAVERAAATRPR